jgi:hypothetical protein
MTTQECTAALNTLAEAVTQELEVLRTEPIAGAVWTFTPDKDAWTVHIDRADGAKLYLSLESSKGYELKDRVSISGSLNIGRNGAFVTVYEGGQRLSPGSITVALSRGPEAIAKEITRRLLPEYLRVYALAMAKLQADNAYDFEVSANLHLLAKAVGTVVPSDKNPNNSYVEAQRESISFHRGEAYGTIRVSNKTAQLELRSLTLTQAVHILSYIKGGK